jgi:hypothetical protein
MENQSKTTSGQGLGIVGLILGILAIPLGIIPCTFMFALLFGAAGIILSIIGLSQANRDNATKGLIIAALICSIIGFSFACIWTFAIGKGIDFMTKSFRHEISIGQKEELHDAFKDFGKELEQTLDELENDTITIVISDSIIDFSQDNIDNLLDNYETLVKDYIKLSEKARDGEISSIVDYTKVSAKALTLSVKLSEAEHHFSPEQKKRFQELHKKYTEALEKVN